MTSLRLLTLLLLLVLPTPLWAQSSDDLQDEPLVDKPKLVLAVLISEGVDEQVRLDVQDLYLTALAKNQGYQLVDREAFFKITEFKDDFELLLCLNQTDCLERLYQDKQLEKYVVVKVVREEDQLVFASSVTSWDSESFSEFEPSYTVPVNDIDALIERTYTAAEAVKLFEEDQPGPSAPQQEQAQGASNWRLWTGIGAAGAGAVLSIVGIVYQLDAVDKRDALAQGYSTTGDSQVSTLSQSEAFDLADQANSSASIGPLAWALASPWSPLAPASSLGISSTRKRPRPNQPLPSTPPSMALGGDTELLNLNYA